MGHQAKRLLGRVRRALDDYGMIRREGEILAVGLSGGKDSMALLWALAQLTRFYPRRFSLRAITVDLGFEGFDTGPMIRVCEELKTPLLVEKTLIGPIVFDARKEENPCSLCANMRRGALCNAAVRTGCGAVALAHHRDDIVETFLLSLVYEGRIHTFSPVTELRRSGVTLVRPLIYSPEKDIREAIREIGLPTAENPCPVGGRSRRQDVRELMAVMARQQGDIRSKLFGAIRRAGVCGFRSGFREGSDSEPDPILPREGKSIILGPAHMQEKGKRE